MRFHKAKLATLIFGLFVFTCQGAFAESGEGEGEKGEAAKEEGAKEGEVKEEGGKKADKTPKEILEYGKKSARLNTLKARIEEGKKKFAEISEAKERSRESQKKQALVLEMLEVNKEIKANEKEFDELRQELQLKYPSMGETVEKRFLQDKEKSKAEPREKVSTVDEQLSAVKKQVDKKYAPFRPVPTDADAVEEANRAAGEASQREKPKRLKLVK